MGPYVIAILFLALIFVIAIAVIARRNDKLASMPLADLQLVRKLEIMAGQYNTVHARELARRAADQKVHF